MPKPSLLLIAVYLLAIVLASYPTSAFAIIFGEDDRLEHFEVNRRYKEYARSIAVIAPARNIERNGADYRWRLEHIPTLGETEIDGKRISPDERFVDQPRCGVGTAFLIAPDVIVTAGHCVINTEGEVTVRDKYIVFDYHINHTTQSVDEDIPSENVYRCVDAVVIEFDAGAGRDFAIVRLDRPVEGRTPLDVRQDGRIENNTRLVQIGHPLGLPLKIAINARVRNNDPHQFFLGDIDSFPGNSGSPIMDASTGIVEGIAVRVTNADENDISAVGYGDSWQVNPITELLEVRRLENVEAVDQGTHVQRINLIPEIAGGFAQGLALFGLIAEGKTEEVLAALEEGIDPNVRDAENRHLLHQAMRHSDIEVARALIDLEVPILIRDVHDTTPLHEAARAGFLEGVDLLVLYDHPVNVINKFGMTAFWMCEKENTAVRDRLLSEGADDSIVPHQVIIDLEEGTIGKYQAFIESIYIDNASIAELLLVEHGIDPESAFAGAPEGKGVMNVIRWDGQTRSFYLYTELMVGTFETLLNIAVGHGAYDVVETLLHNGADPNNNAALVYNPLCLATTPDMASLLLNYGADIHCNDNEVGYTPLACVTVQPFIAGRFSSPDRALSVLHFLLEEGANVNGNGNEDRNPDGIPLLLAIRLGSAHLPGKAGADQELYQYSLSAIQLLLDHDANANDRWVSPEGQVGTIVDCARRRGFDDAVALLRAAGGRPVLDE